MKKKRGKVTKDGSQPLIDRTLQEVEKIEGEFQRGKREDFKKKITDRQLEHIEKERVKDFKRDFLKDLSMKHRKNAQKMVGGVRGKFHPSKKGTSKTVSRRSLKRDSFKKD